MPITKDKNYLYIFSAFLILTFLYLIAEYILTGQKMGVPLDDTWIHFRFAENFAKGYLFQYNIGEPIPGTTSPLWVILMSIPFIFSSNLFLPFSFIIGSIFFLLTVFEVYKLSQKLGFTKNYSLLISFLTLVCGRLLWSSLSGMEITLACWLLVLITRIHLLELETEKIRPITGLLLGLCAVTRPEAILFALIYYFLTILILKKKLKANVESLFYSASIFIAILIPYSLFSYSTTGNFLPTTFKGQNAGLRLLPDIDFLRETGKLFFKDNTLILVLWFFGIFFFIRGLINKKFEIKFLLVNIWIILLPLISSFIAPNWRHHGRYLIPLIPFINITAIYIFVYKFNRSQMPSPKEARVYRIILITILFVLSGINAFVFARALGWNTDNINNQQINTANWINANIPNEKCIAVNDIGAITFLTNKRIVDMEGLVTPEIFKINTLQPVQKNLQTLYLLRRNGVNYLIIYPDWYVSFVNSYGSFFERVYSARLENNTICGGDNMVVYKIKWEQLNLN
jgi:arabinofuranosyltransferase